jgi:succinate dehydrogenase / fumarate reductase cytochrome b subunit
MLARAHSFLGVVPLGVYLCFHLHAHWPALRDRELWVDRALNAPSRSWLIALVIVPLGLHAALGAARLLRASGDDADALAGSGALRALQAMTGALVLGFVVYHVASFWALGEGAYTSPRASYAWLWQNLGRPAVLMLYLAGISATCFHFAHGLTRAAVTFRLVRTARAVKVSRVAAGLCGFVLFALFVQLLGHFALGTPVF